MFYELFLMTVTVSGEATLADHVTIVVWSVPYAAIDKSPFHCTLLTGKTPVS